MRICCQCAWVSSFFRFYTCRSGLVSNAAS